MCEACVRFHFHYGPIPVLSRVMQIEDEFDRGDSLTRLQIEALLALIEANKDRIHFGDYDREFA